MIAKAASLKDIIESEPHRLEGDKTWDEEHIRKRTEKIAEEVIKHWDIVKLIREVQP